MDSRHVLIDLIQDNMGRFRKVLDEAPEEALHWQPDPEANSIAVTLWHVGRIMDLFVTQRLEGKHQDEEHWFTGGWAEQSGYDPRGIGLYGWGAIIGYSQEEVAAIPDFSSTLLREYLDAVSGHAEEYLQKADEEAFQTTPEGENARSPYTQMKIAVSDMTRHMGEIYALQAMWKRQISG